MGDEPRRPVELLVRRLVGATEGFLWQRRHRISSPADSMVYTAATSLSRRVRAGGSSSNSLLDAGDIGDVGSSSERAYSTPFSSVMPCPSVHAASHEASFSEERAASRYGSSHASTSGECWYATAPIVSRSASAAPNSVAARSAPPSAPDIHASPSRLSEAIILSPSSLHTTRLSP